uniref:ORF16 n=1 Tax=Malaco herpesvirus 4 TaxID=3031800 RepID=A0AA48SEZ8_9VIRU|nr:TPA_asm: ORF16 [Malaco herpesvirus 4]
MRCILKTGGGLLSLHSSGLSPLSSSVYISVSISVSSSSFSSSSFSTVGSVIGTLIDNKFIDGPPLFSLLKRSLHVSVSTLRAALPLTAHATVVMCLKYAHSPADIAFFIIRLFTVFESVIPVNLRL